MARPLLNVAAVRRIAFTCSPPIGPTILYRSQLEEMPLVHFGFGGPHVVPLDAQRSDKANSNLSLLQHLTHDGSLWRFTRLDRAGGHLNTGNLERDIIVSEDEQLLIANDVADDLSNESALRPPLTRPSAA